LGRIGIQNLGNNIEKTVGITNDFYNTALKRRRVSVREIVELLHPGIDVSDLLNLGMNDDHIGPYTRVLTEILRKMGYPIHF